MGGLGIGAGEQDATPLPAPSLPAAWAMRVRVPRPGQGVPEAGAPPPAAVSLARRLRIPLSCCSEMWRQLLRDTDTSVSGPKEKKRKKKKRDRERERQGRTRRRRGGRRWGKTCSHRRARSSLGHHCRSPAPDLTASGVWTATGDPPITVRSPPRRHSGPPHHRGEPGPAPSLASEYPGAARPQRGLGGCGAGERPG